MKYVKLLENLGYSQVYRMWLWVTDQQQKIQKNQEENIYLPGCDAHNPMLKSIPTKWNKLNFLSMFNKILFSESFIHSLEGLPIINSDWLEKPASAQ